MAGDHRGIDAVLGFFGRTMELTAGTFRAELHDVVADDQHTLDVITSRQHARRRSGVRVSPPSAPPTGQTTATPIVPPAREKGHLPPL
jgi:hypothetical protein